MKLEIRSSQFEGFGARFNSLFFPPLPPRTAIPSFSNFEFRISNFPP